VLRAVLLRVPHQGSLPSRWGPQPIRERQPDPRSVELGLRIDGRQHQSASASAASAAAAASAASAASAAAAPASASAASAASAAAAASAASAGRSQKADNWGKQMRLFRL